MGGDFMKMYQEMHAVEKPSDISHTELFANTETLIASSDNPENIIFLRGDKETAEEMDKKTSTK